LQQIGLVLCHVESPSNGRYLEKVGIIDTHT
jgi:hypothetical protein